MLKMMSMLRNLTLLGFVGSSDNSGEISPSADTVVLFGTEASNAVGIASVGWPAKLLNTHKCEKKSLNTEIRQVLL